MKIKKNIEIIEMGKRSEKFRKYYDNYLKEFFKDEFKVDAFYNCKILLSIKFEDLEKKVDELYYHELKNGVLYLYAENESDLGVAFKDFLKDKEKDANFFVKRDSNIVEAVKEIAEIFKDYLHENKDYVKRKIERVIKNRNLRYDMFPTLEREKTIKERTYEKTVTSSYPQTIVDVFEKGTFSDLMSIHTYKPKSRYVRKINNQDNYESLLESTKEEILNEAKRKIKGKECEIWLAENKEIVKNEFFKYTGLNADDVKYVDEQTHDFEIRANNDVYYIELKCILSTRPVIFLTSDQYKFAKKHDKKWLLLAYFEQENRLKFYRFEEIDKIKEIDKYRVDFSKLFKES